MRPVRLIRQIRPIRNHKFFVVVIALIISGLIVSLIWPDGNPRSLAAGFLTSTTDADGNAHLGNNAVNDTNYYDTTTDSDPSTQELIGVDPNWKNGVVRESYAVNYDGSNDYTDFGSATRLDDLQDNALTAEAWVRFDGNSDTQSDVILGKRDNVAPNGWVLFITNTSGSQYLRGFVDTNSTDGNGTSSTTITSNTWTHVAMTYDDGGDRKVRLYIDGAEVSYSSQTAATGTIVSDASENFVLADVSVGTGGSTLPYDGVIDEVRLSNNVRYTTTFTPSRRHTEDSNTVGLWHMDEGTDNTCSGGTNDVCDSSQYRNDGANTNGPTWVTGARAILARGANNITLGSTSSVTHDKGYDLRGARSPGLDFDGTNDYVESSTFSISIYPLTISAWVKTDTTTGAHSIAYYGSGSGGSGQENGILINGTEFWALTQVGEVTNVQATTGGGATGQWFHVVGVFSSATSRQIYVNGALGGTNTTSATPSPSSPTMTIGTRHSLTNQTWDGLIDDVRIYNRALAAAEIIKLYNGNTDPDSSGLQGLWHFDEGAGTSAYDYSGNGNTGTLTAGPTWVEGQTTYPTDTPGIKFDGTDDYVNLSANASNLIFNAPATVSGWVKPTNALSDTADTIFFLGDGNNLVEAGTEAFALYYGAATSGLTNESFTIIRYLGANPSDITVRGLTDGVSYQNTWVHFTLVAFDTSTVWKLYLNGVEKTLTADTNNTGTNFGFGDAVSPESKVYIGAREHPAGTQSLPFGGQMDDVRLYNRALSAGEAIDLYQQKGFDSITTNLVGKWDLNDGQGTTAADTSGNSYNGTLTGAGGLPKWDSGIGTGNPSTGPGFSGNKNVTGQSWYTWRQKGGTFATIPIRTHDDSKQLGSEGVYVGFANPSTSSGGILGVHDYISLSSWAVEASSTSAPQRGTENSFPDQAYLVATAAGLDILNAKNNKLWMRLAGAANNLLPAANNTTVWAQNGAIWVGSASGLVKIDLAQDLARLYTSSGNSTYQSTTGAIADRADALGYGAASGAALVATSVKDVHGTVISNKSYIVAGTATGASVVQDETLTGAEVIYDYDSDATAGAQNDYDSVQLTSGGELYGLTDTTNRIDRWDNVNSDAADQLTSSDRNWTTATTPALNANPSGNPDALSVNVNASTAQSGSSDSIFVADANGFTKIDDHTTQASGTATYYERTGTVGSSNWSSERYKGAVKFDGTNDYVSVNSFNVSGGLTLAGWAYFKNFGSGSDQDVIFRKGTSYGATNAVWGLEGQDSRAHFFPKDSDITSSCAANVSGVCSNQSLVTNTWYFLVGTYDGTTMNIYVNGILDGSKTYGGGIANSANNINIGARSDGSDTLNGYLDELRVYNRALSASEVSDIYNGNPSSSGVVGLWHFDDATGTTARDASGSGNNGTLTNGPKFVFPAIAGSADKAVAVGSKATSGGNNPANYALTFAHASSNYVSVPNTASVKSRTTATIEAWYKPASNPTNNAAIYYESTATDGFSRFAIYHYSNGDLVAVARDTDGGAAFTATETNPFTAGQWYHVAATYDAGTDNLILYRNGVQVASNTAAKGAFTSGNPANTMAIGAYINNGPTIYSVNGTIDEVRLSSSVRYGSSFTPQKRFGTDGQTIGLWHFDEGSGTSATDSSGNANTGTLVSTPTWATLTVADEAGPYFVGNSNFAWVGTNGASADDGSLTLVNLNSGARVKYYDTSNHADLPDNDITSLSMTNSGLGIAGTEAGAAPFNETGTFVEAGSQADTNIQDVRFKGSIRLRGNVRLK